MSSDPLAIINQDRFDEWQKDLIYEKKYAWSDPRKAERNQQELERAVEAGNTQVRDLMLRRLGVESSEDARKAVPQLPRPLTQAAMQRLPRHDEEKVYEALRVVNPLQAATPAFWTLCHAVWIGDWKFDGDVASIFMEGGKDKTSDQRARNFLRRTGGLPRVRGSVSVLEDCQISAAWWRCRTAEVASDAASDCGETLSFAEAHEVLWHSGVWKDNLARWPVRRVTALSAPPALAAVVSVLARHGLAPKQGDAKKQVQAVMWAVARVSYNYCMHSMDWSQLVAAAQDGLAHSDHVNVVDEVDEEE